VQTFGVETQPRYWWIWHNDNKCSNKKFLFITEASDIKLQPKFDCKTQEGIRKSEKNMHRISDFQVFLGNCNLFSQTNLKFT